MSRSPRPFGLAVALALALAGCSGGARTPAVEDAGPGAAAITAAENARADSLIAARRATGTTDAALAAEVVPALSAWLDGVRRRDPAFTPESLSWQPERRLTPDPGMRFTAAFFDTLQRGDFGLVHSPDGVLAVDPQFRRFFEDETARFTIMADPMVTLFDFATRRRHLVDTGTAGLGDVFESVRWLGPRRFAVGGWLRAGARNAPAVRVYDLQRGTCREGLAPAPIAAQP